MIFDEFYKKIFLFFQILCHSISRTKDPPKNMLSGGSRTLKMS